MSVCTTLSVALAALMMASLFNILERGNCSYHHESVSNPAYLSYLASHRVRTTTYSPTVNFTYLLLGLIGHGGYGYGGYGHRGYGHGGYGHGGYGHGGYGRGGYGHGGYGHGGGYSGYGHGGSYGGGPYSGYGHGGGYGKKK